MVVNEEIKPHDIKAYIDYDTHYIDVATDEKVTSLPDDGDGYCLVVEPETVTYFADFVYDSKNDVLVIFDIKINAHSWGPIPQGIVVAGRYDIKRNKKIMYVEWEFEYADDNGWTPVEKSYVSLKLSQNGSLLNFLGRCVFNQKVFMEEVLKIFPEYCIFPGNYIFRMESPRVLQSYLLMNDPFPGKRKTKKQEERLRLLLSIPLPPADIGQGSPGLKKTGQERRSIIQRAGGYCVIRTFHGNFEGARLYIGKKETWVLMKTNDGRYVMGKPHHFFPKDLMLYKWVLRYDHSLLYRLDDSDICETGGTQLEFIMDFIRLIEPPKRLYGIIGMLGNPMLEKLVKSGFRNALTEVWNCHMGAVWVLSPSVLADEMFSPNSKKAGLYQWMGLNQYQAGRVAETVSADMYRSLVPTKQFLCGKKEWQGISISHIDNRTFDRVYGFFSKNCNATEGKISGLSPYYSRKKMLRVLDCYEKLNEATDEMSLFDARRVLLRWRDYIEVVIQLNEQGDCPDRFDPCCADPERLMELHDQASDYHMFVFSGYDRYSFDELRGSWEKYVFEDGDYLVRVSDSPRDIMEEGTHLRHCVATYIEPVSEGERIVVFIRKKSEPDVPFYTVEVSTDGTIQQVHGIRNCNVPKDGPLMEFINLWAQEKGLKIGAINQIR